MTDYLNQNLVSYHFDRQSGFNENNPGIGIEDKEGALRRLAGIYKNSINKNSLYALMAYQPLEYKNFNAGIFGGGVTGYKELIRPAAGAMLSYDGEDYGVNLSLVPNVPSIGVKGFAGLQMKYKLK